MATYSDGKTEAMVGDEVRCGIQNCAWCDQKNQYHVTKVYERDVQLRNERSRHSSDLFQLVSRAEEAAPSQPLVKWPEETMYKSLERGEYFVYLDEPQVPCVSLGGGQHIQLIKTPKWPAWTLLTCVVESMVPVRRIQRVGAEQFEVI